MRNNRCETTDAKQPMRNNRCRTAMPNSDAKHFDARCMDDELFGGSNRRIVPRSKWYVLVAVLKYESVGIRSEERSNEQAKKEKRYNECESVGIGSEKSVKLWFLFVRDRRIC